MWGDGGREPGDGDAVPGDARNWALGAHLSAFAGAWFFLAFTGPLVVYLLVKDRHPYAAQQAREALNFNLTFLIVNVVGLILGVLIAIGTLGFGLLVVVPVAVLIALAWAIAIIVAALRASDGRPFRYPLTIRFVT